MSYLLNVRRDEPALLVGVRHAVVLSFLDAWNSCRLNGLGPQEPDFVASLVLRGTRIMNRAWSRTLSRHQIAVGVIGVYCHQKPKVHYQNMHGRNCEIGDILWCHFHSDRTGQITRNAILFQAKCSSKLPHRITKPERDQFHLYSHWPEFEYVSSGPQLNGQHRQVIPAGFRRGAQYLLLDKRPDEVWESGLTGAPGTYPLVDHADLGGEFVATLEFLSGDPFDERQTAAGERGWSQVVWDILDSSIGKAFRRIRSGHDNQPRVTGTPPTLYDGCYYRSRETSLSLSLSALPELGDGELPPSDAEPPRDGRPEEWNDDGGSSVSTIVVKTSESEE
jgi:hypothetical protein